jgi:zinc protease
MNRLSGYVPFLLLFLVFGGCERQQKQLRFDPDFTIGTLRNGVSYYVRHNGKPDNRLELRLVMRTGSVLEEDDQQGLAHFLEHMAFNGTAHYDKQALIDYLEGIGMRFGPDLNAYTSFDETVYKLQLPTDNAEAIDAGFQILRDWAFGIRNDSEEIDAERGVVIEEWRGRRGAGQRIWDKHFEVLFHGSQYAVRRPIGQKEVLDTFDHGRLRDFYNTWYRPELTAVIAIGDFDEDTLVAKIREFFNDEPARKRPKARPDFDMPGHEERLVSIVTDAEATSSSVNIYYKHEVSLPRTVGDFRRELIESLFTGMLNQRYDEERQKADAPFLSGYTSKSAYVRASEFFMLGAQVSDNGWLRGMTAVLSEALRVQRFGFTAGELERRKAEMMSGIERAYAERNSTESRAFARRCIRHFNRGVISVGVEDRLELYKQLLPTIELTHVNALAAELMTEDNCVVLVDGPEKDGVTPPSKDQVLKVFEHVAGLELEPYVDDVEDEPLVAQLPDAGRVVRRERVEEVDLTIWHLSNGARIMLKPTTFKQDEILLHAWSSGGHSLVGDSDYIPAASADSLMSRSGWGNFSHTQLQKQLAGKTASASAYIGELSEGVRGGCRPADLEVMLQLVHLIFTAPRVDEEACQAYLARLRTDLENRLARPEEVFNDEIAITMSQGHLRRKPWTPETLAEMDAERSLQLFRERFESAGDFTFLFVGNFDIGELEALVETYVGSLPTGSGESWRDPDVQPPAGKIDRTVRKGVAPKSRVRMKFGGDITFNYQERYWVYSMVSALRTRLREEMREAIGGTYSVRAYASIDHYPVPRFEINIGFGCAPDQVELLIDVVRREIENLQSELLEESYLTKVRQTQLREREVSLERNSFWLHILHYYDWHGEDVTTVLDFENYVNALSLADIRDTARRCFDTPNVATFILRPEEQPGR